MVTADEDFVAAEFCGYIRISDITKEKQSIFATYFLINASELCIIRNSWCFGGKVFISKVRV